MKIQIKSIVGVIVFEGDFSCISDAVKAAVAAKANLRYANLSSANLSYADLSYADLIYADLTYANLSSANMTYANLRFANMSYADMRSANLSYADLSYVDLTYANMRSANLSSANLSYANLSYAGLSSANLSSAKNSELAVAMTRILPEGEIVGWEKLRDGVIAKLVIPAHAKRSHAFGRKCRAEFAKVVELSDGDGKTVKSGASGHDSSFEYHVGKTVQPTEKFSEDWTKECGSGIHFFITKDEAAAYEP